MTHKRKPGSSCTGLFVGDFHSAGLVTPLLLQLVPPEPLEGPESVKEVEVIVVDTETFSQDYAGPGILGMAAR